MTTEELKTKIIEANRKYRLGEDSGLSDQEYDDLCESFQKEVGEDEYNLFRNSLNEGAVEYGKKIKHKFIAGSLDKLKYEEPEEIKRFISRNVRNKLNVSAKIDGLTGILHYNGGRLIGFATRGDGYEGISILEKAEYISGIPSTLSYLDDLYVRGELVILKSDYEKINGTSPRNVVAGLINRKEWDVEEMKNVTFVPYTIMGNKYCKVSQFEELVNLGFSPAWYMNIDLEECNSEDFVEELFKIVSMDFKYQTDGLVLCDSEYINENKYRPDSQVAFKVNQQKFTTRLMGIEWQGPSKDGKMTPVGILEPVNCEGVMVSKCTLHNMDFINEKKLRVGDTVSIVRSGDVIPKMLGVVCTSNDSTEIKFPETCPCCGSKLTEDGPFLYCRNENCSDKTTYQVMHFIKKCGVEYASFKTLKNFGISDLNTLLEFKPNTKYRSETKFASELKEKIFTLSPQDLFCKVNMKDIGETLLTKIVEFYGWDRISSTDIDSDPLTILPEGIGDITMNKFLSEYKKNIKLVERITSDVRYHPTEGKIVKNSEKNGISFCVTGTVYNFKNREELISTAENLGYTFKSGVSKGLNYLVNNDIGSSSGKNKKAKQLGIPIISETEFIKLIGYDSFDNDSL